MLTSTTQVPNMVGEFADMELLDRAVTNFVWGRYAQVRDLPQKSGELIKFRRYGNLTAATTALTQGVTPIGSQLSVTDISATPLQYGDFVEMPDYLTWTVIEPLIQETAEQLGDQASETFDTLTRDVVTAGTTVQYASTAVSRITVAAGMILNTAEAREATMTLQLNKGKYITEMVNPSDGVSTVPLRPAYISWVGPRGLRDLKASTEFVTTAKYGTTSDIMPDEVGTLDDIRFLLTQNPKVFTGAGAAGIDVHATVVIAKNAYGVSRINGKALESCIFPLGTVGSDPLKQRSTMGWKGTFVATRLNESWILRIEHAVS